MTLSLLVVQLDPENVSRKGNLSWPDCWATKVGLCKQLVIKSTGHAISCLPTVVNSWYLLTDVGRYETCDCYTFIQIMKLIVIATLDFNLYFPI